jgi:hypothetical protein
LGGKMAEDKFKLPRSSYEELSKIIRAYGRTTKPSSLDEISKLTGINKTGVSANNAFLVNIGVIEGGNLKLPTEKGTQLALALEHEIPDEITKIWRKIVDENEFLNKMVQAVGVRKGMDVSHLENHIAFSAGESKSKEVMTGSRAVIDILRSSGLVKQDGEQILPNQTIKRTSDNAPSAELTEIVNNPVLIASSNKKTLGDTVVLHIEVRVNVTASELDGLGEKLRELIKAVSE